VPIEKGMRISINIIAPNEKNVDALKKKDGDRNDTKTDNKSVRCARREGDRAQPERPGHDDIARPGRSKTKLRDR
jgi:hypothetical protein